MTQQAQAANSRIEGMICAPFTPFDEAGNINLDAIPAYSAMLKENGVIGVYVNGSSGEGQLLTEAERRQTVEAWGQHCGDAFKLIVHVGALCLKTARELAKHAEQQGAYAVSAMAPTFPPLGSVDQLVGYCEDLAAATPNLPFYFYHIPALTRVDLPMMEFLAQAEQRIPNLAGIKYTSADLYDMTRCTRYEAGKFDVLAGLDETMLGALSVANSRGFIGGTFNYSAPVYVKLIEAFRAGDIDRARQLQEHSQDIIDVLVKYRGNMVAGKQIMKLVGLDLGPVRKPLPSMAKEQYFQMARDLDRAGFFETCCAIEGQRASLLLAQVG